MSRYEGRDWNARRRRAAGQAFRANAAWILSSILVAATAALLVVGQKVRFDGVRLAADFERTRNEKLRSDWNAHQIRHQRKAARAELLPMAARLGLTETTTESFRIVAFEAGPGTDGPGLMDRIVAPALAGEPGATASRSGRRPAGVSSGR